MNFTRILEQWYGKNKRDLPWRRTRNPYHIWVSEIILQQTRISQGLDYYYRFLQKFPDIQSLAESREEEVLKIWQGLGYYSRARNMHAAAKEIMNFHKGIFPETYEEIRKLKGIGDYTAAAIASIAYGIPAPVVDGNVLRLFARFFGIKESIDTGKGKQDVLEKAKQVVNRRHPGDFNQAIMEFGALQCKPVPDCITCLLISGCVAFQQKIVNDLPVRSKKQSQRTRYFHYLIITTGGGKKHTVFLRKRTGNDIWKNLFDFPLIEKEKVISLMTLMKSKEWQDLVPSGNIKLLRVSEARRHILTHQVIMAKFYHIEAPENIDLPFQKVNMSEISKYPLPRLIDKYIQEVSLE